MIASGQVCKKHSSQFHKDCYQSHFTFPTPSILVEANKPYWFTGTFDQANETGDITKNSPESPHIGSFGQ